MLKYRLKLGTYFGIGLYVHWTFALIVAYVAYVTAQAGGDGPAILFGLLVLGTLYLCVTLHEYGHALAARNFGIPTLDITLLPIGGVARLERMPRVPWQELLVAVAGPAVNVMIAVPLLVGLIVTGQGASAVDFLSGDTLGRPSVVGFVTQLLLANLFLVAFNMIPAFPMDGGRVFRSLLAMVIEYRRATWIAARVGIGCAVLMAIAGIWVSPVMPLIAVFICWAGLAEARQVEVTESVRGLRVGDAMVHNVPTVGPTTPLSQLAELWASLPARVVPVTDAAGRLLGIVWLEDLAAAIQQGRGWQTAADLVRRDGPVAWPEQPVEQLLAQIGRRSGRQLPVMDPHGRLVGLLDLDTLVHRSTVSRGFHPPQSSVAPPPAEAPLIAEVVPANPYTPPLRTGQP